MIHRHSLEIMSDRPRTETPNEPPTQPPNPPILPKEFMHGHGTTSPSGQGKSGTVQRRRRSVSAYASHPYTRALSPTHTSPRSNPHTSEESLPSDPSPHFLLPDTPRTTTTTNAYANATPTPLGLQRLHISQFGQTYAIRGSSSADTVRSNLGNSFDSAKSAKSTHKTRAFQHNASPSTESDGDAAFCLFDSNESMKLRRKDVVSSEASSLGPRVIQATTVLRRRSSQERAAAAMTTRRRASDASRDGKRASNAFDPVDTIMNEKGTAWCMC